MRVRDGILVAFFLLWIRSSIFLYVLGPFVFYSVHFSRLIMSFVCFSIWLFLLFLFFRSLFRKQLSPLPVKSCKLFSLFFFFSLSAFFGHNENVDIVKLGNVLLFLCFDVVLGNFSPPEIHRNSSSFALFSPRTCIISFFTFRCLIHLEFIFVDSIESFFHI